MRSIKERTCCFTGHREIILPVETIQYNLEKQLKELISSGVIYYGAGGALGFDTIAALTVIKLRQIYPQIKLIMVLPCKEQTKGWNSNDIGIYNYILNQADKVVYTSENYYPGCMHKRNRHLVDNSSHCICYLEKNTGGTAYTVNYAKEKGLTIYNVANNTLII
jgi:uncharacterized phage-like protein YoqJ